MNESTSSTPTPSALARTWVLSRETVGLVEQGLGLAQAVGGRIERKTIKKACWWRNLPPACWPPHAWRPTTYDCGLEPPWPELLLTVGKSALPAALAVRRVAGDACRVVCIQHPGWAGPHFDAVVASSHERRLRGANVIPVLGAVGRVGQKKLAFLRATSPDPYLGLPFPRLGVLLGGHNSAYAGSPAQWRALGATLVEAMKPLGGSALIIPSRRTPQRCYEAFLEPWREIPHRVPVPGEPNPYQRYLAWSEFFAVTCDSVNMLSEACSTGQAVWILRLPYRRVAWWRAAKFERFLSELVRTGRARVFRDTLQPWREQPPLDETRRVAKELRRRLFPPKPPPGAETR